MVVAFSGGADSAFLAWVATDTLGADGCSAPPRSPRPWPPRSWPTAGRWPPNGGSATSRWRPTSWPTRPMRPTTARRCYHCKTSLLEALAPLAAGGRTGRRSGPAADRACSG